MRGRFITFDCGEGVGTSNHAGLLPHRLKRLHAMLMEYPEYRGEALEVHGYFLSPKEPQLHPTVVDVLGSEHAPRSGEVHIDAEAVSVVEFNDAEGLAKEVELSKGERPA